MHCLIRTTCSTLPCLFNRTWLLIRHAPTRSLPPEVQRVVLAVVLDPDTSLLRNCIAPSKLVETKRSQSARPKSLR